ncbi:MAG: FadR family transcriptional regulator [Candidatus Dormibacteraeota bacterium]|nr:FadR family transcriptional regulator [Candidatus Dormibacteraeota bacterium]
MGGAAEVQLRTLPMQVAGVLARRIATGEFADGLLPSEQQIAAEFGFSRAVAREGLKVLASLDMVEISQGRRVVVRAAAEWDYLNPLLLEWLPEEEIPHILQELHEARLIIEPGLAARAARTATADDLARMRATLDGMAAALELPERFLEHDLQFHLEICKATRNRMLDRFMYASRWWQSASRRITNRPPSALPTALADHRHIYEAIEAGEPDQAEREMRRHLTMTATVLDRAPA